MGLQASALAFAQPLKEHSFQFIALPSAFQPIQLKNSKAGKLCSRHIPSVSLRIKVKVVFVLELV